MRCGRFRTCCIHRYWMKSDFLPLCACTWKDSPSAAKLLLIWKFLGILDGLRGNSKPQFSAWYRNVSPTFIAIPEVRWPRFSFPAVTTRYESKLKTKARGFHRQSGRRWSWEARPESELEGWGSESANSGAGWKSNQKPMARSQRY